MVTNVYAIFDVKADLYNAPFTMPRDGMAIRAFVDLVNDPQTTIHKHPADYKLVQLGTFDDTTGEITGLRPLKSLGFASEHYTADKE